MRPSTTAPTGLRISAIAVLAIAVMWSCQEVEVTAVSVSSVTVFPTVTTMSVGERRQLRALLLANGGTALTARPTTWSMGDTSVARVDSVGRVEAVAAGRTTVQARSGDAVGEGRVEVTEPREDDAPGDDEGPGEGGGAKDDDGDEGDKGGGGEGGGGGDR